MLEKMIDILIPVLAVSISAFVAIFVLSVIALVVYVYCFAKDDIFDDDEEDY